MARSIWQASVVDEAGNVVPGATIDVVSEVTGLPVTLYDARTGGTNIGNPAFADVNGFIQFYTEPTRIRVTATGGAFTITWRNIQLVEPQESSTDATAGRVVTTDALGDNGGPIYTTDNLNINEFGNVGGTNDLVATGFAVDATTAWLVLEVQSFVSPTSITLTSTLDIRDAAFIQRGFSLGGANVVMNTRSSSSVCIVEVTGCTGLVSGQSIMAVKDTGTTLIKVNF